ncbi:UNVERIFIED_CONTAM: hypothetical protein PYX00_005404 [Menopon gallinae]|uniref:Protein CNPPD1 n=1 Tax=Menopon gallinae TaxID=328185 RepID=A0AAW2HR09_9NEOP
MLTLPLRTGSFCDPQRGFKNYEDYITRIEKSLYYVSLPKAYCTSLPCTELASEIFSEINKFSLDKLHLDEAAKLSHNACISPCSLVLALLYLDRLKSINPKYLTKVSPSELFLISLMVGSKFLQDDGEEDEVNNYEWAASAGVNVDEVNRAEKQFLDAIKWEVFVSEKEFWDRFRIMERKLGLRQGCKRGWFTYTELHLLLELIDISNIVHSFCMVTTACLTSYTASMLTLLGSALLVSQIPGLGFKTKTEQISNNQNWSNISSYNSANFMIQDWPITPPLVNSNHYDFGSELEPNITLNDLLIPNSLVNNEKHLFMEITSPQDELYPHVRDIAIKRHNDAFNTTKTVWDWTDVIINYLLMNSVSSILFPAKDF